MESISFADVLFTAITLLIIYVILYYVNKAKRKVDQPDQGQSSVVDETADDIEDNQEADKINEP